MSERFGPATPRVIVTAVGGGVGQSILKSLQLSGDTAIGVDADPLAAGLYAVSAAYVVSAASDPRFVEQLLDICRREECRLIFPGCDPELPVLARAAERFEESGVCAVVSSARVIQICDDKLETYRFLRKHGFESPPTHPLSAEVVHALGFPLVLKPRRGGSCSRGVVVVRDEREFAFRLATVSVDNFIAQEYLPGDEFTCGSVTLGGRFYGPIVMRRVLRGGDTYRAYVEKRPEIDAYVRAVAEALAPFGPCNFQLRMRNGKPCIFEINARCSGTTHARALAGFNEVALTTEFVTRGEVPSYTIRRLTIFRYWKELALERSRVEQIERQGEIHDGTTRL